MDKTTFSFPVNIGNGLTPNDDNIYAYYQHTEVKHPGGYFPVGTNTVWHGGIHIHGKLHSPVHAMSNGKIVAARLAEEEMASQYYGSNNFILLSHSLKGKKYYSLYLHLHWEHLNSSNSNIAKIAWLLDKGGKPDTKILNQLKSGHVCIFNTPVKAGDKIWTLGEYGSNKIIDYRASMIHWEVFSEDEMSGSWESVVDPDNDFHCDNKKLVSLIDQPVNIMGLKLKPDGNLDKNEIIEFYKKPSTNKRLLRYYQCKFISEHAINWDAAVNKMKGKFYTTGLADRLNKYAFWGDAKAVLPANKIVWHYNPIAFIEQATIDKDVFTEHEFDLMINEIKFIVPFVENQRPSEYSGNYCMAGAERALSKLLGDTKKLYSVNRLHQRQNSVSFSGKGAKDRGHAFELLGYTKSHFTFKDYQINHALRRRTKNDKDYRSNLYDVVTLKKGSALFDYLDKEVKSRNGYHIFYMSVSDDFHTLLLTVHVASAGNSTYTIYDQHGETSSSGKFSDVEEGIARQTSWTFLNIYRNFGYNPKLYGKTTTRLWKIQRK